MTAPGVSDTELSLLIAGLNSTPPGPAPTGQPEMGPWSAATYRGACAGCGAAIAEFDMIRASSADGWLAECCGTTDHDPTSGLVVPAPQRPAGPPPSTVRELRQVLIDYEANRPRSMQKALGPSELGTPCQQQIARKLAGAPRRPITAPTWAPFQGTAVHASMEEVVGFWNARLGRDRWLAEDRLIVTESAPSIDGRPDYPAVAGNGDAFDQDFDMVVDWKHVGKTALEKLQRAKRAGKPSAEQVSAEYRTQGHLYGLGHAIKGRSVRWVRLVLLARDYDYDKSDEWTEAYNEQIALRAIGRYWDIFDLVHELGGPAAGPLITAVPASPSSDNCKFCPFHRPGVASDWDGCAGDRPPQVHLAKAAAGLIEGQP